MSTTRAHSSEHIYLAVGYIHMLASVHTLGEVAVWREGMQKYVI